MIAPNAQFFFYYLKFGKFLYFSIMFRYTNVHQRRSSYYFINIYICNNYFDFIYLFEQGNMTWLIRILIIALIKLIFFASNYTLNKIINIFILKLHWLIRSYYKSKVNITFSPSTIPLIHIWSIIFLSY